MKDILQHINKAFENKVRLGVMSILMVNHEATFNELKETLGVTDGNLASHLKALESKDYIVVRKEFVNRKPLTTYSINNEGRLAFKNHIDALERLLK